MTARSYKSYRSALLLTLMVFEKKGLVAANEAYPKRLSSLLETFSFRHSQMFVDHNLPTKLALIR